MSAATVLSNPELVEAVILYLPIRDIFIVQMVCRLWRDIVPESKSLRHKTFQFTLEEFEQRAELVPQRTIDSTNPLAEVALVAIFTCERLAWSSKDASWRRLQLLNPPEVGITVIIS